MAATEFKRIREIFEQALDRDTRTRLSFVEEACGDEDHLKEKVERLLDAHAQAEANSPIADLLPEKEEFREGTVIGPYEILEKLGEGGQAWVFLAQQTTPVRRRVALKFLRTGMGDAEFIARFNFERQTLATLEHPNIAGIFDAGTTPSGRPWIAMEWVDGKPITTCCRERALPIPDRLDLLRQACDAIQHAHRRGILHRDLKPGNLLVAEADGKLVLKVIDFGIAKAQTDEMPLEMTLTQPGMVFGTPAYISPEQARLTPGGIDTRSDVYSLGVILYELLTGTPPLQRERVTSMGFDELLRAICDEEAPLPSTRLRSLTVARQEETAAAMSIGGRRELLRQCRLGLNWIVARALEKDPDRRYDSPGALAEDLDRFAKDLPLEAGPPSFRYRAGKWIKRRRREVIAAGLVMVALVAGASVAWRYWTQYLTEQKERQKVSDLVQSRNVGSQIRIGNETAFLIESLAGREDGAALVQEWADRVDRGEWGDWAANDAYNRIILGKVYCAMGRTGEAEAQFSLAMEGLTGSALRPDRHSNVALELRGWLAYLYLEQGRYEEARELASANSKNWTWWRYWDRRMDAVSQWCDWLEANRDTLPPPADSEIPHPWFLKFQVRFERDYDRWVAYPSGTKMEELERAARHRIELHATDPNRSHELWSAKADLARAIGYMHRPEEGVPLMNEVLEHYRATSGPGSEKAIATELDLAWIYNASHKLKEAATLLEETLQRSREHLGPDHELTQYALFDLALVYSLWHQPQKADACRRSLVDIWIAPPAPASPAP